MGYFVENKQIATITEPKTISLADNPNYIIFERNDNGEDTPVELYITVKGGLAAPYDLKYTEITFMEKLDELSHQFIGTGETKEVNDTTFYIGDIETTEAEEGQESQKTYTPIPAETIAENLKNCLMTDGFFRNNFYISIPPETQGNAIKNASTIRIVSKGCGDQYAFAVEEKEGIFTKTEEDGQTIYTNDFYTITLRETTNHDSIDNGQGDTEIQIDLYGDTGIFLGKNDFAETISSGTFRADVSKKYFGQPVWFDVNTLIDSKMAYSDSFLTAIGWTDAGTVGNYRLAARRKSGVNLDTFFYSDVFYTVTGYKRNLEANDLSEYIYDTHRKKTIRPLTNQPPLTHIKGQRQYFNFLLSDPDHNTKRLQVTDYKLDILFRLYTPSGTFIDSVRRHSQNHNLFRIANTIELGIDYLTEGYENVGIVKAYLCHDGEVVSQPLEFRILPDCLYGVHDFAFLNALGGWSSFNFSSTEKTEFKADANTYYSTQTPQSNISSRIEGIHSKDVDEKFIVKSMPVDEATSEWLKEMSASVAVYEIATGRYVVVDEFTLKYNSDEDLFQYEMKYHYSDSYNAK